jgi:selenocysteine lyase/cysteine desulfurase
MAIDWNQVRSEFPALQNRVFLNTATYGQTPRRTVEAVMRHFTRRDETACEDFLDWFDDADAIRANIGRLLNCTGEDIAFFVTASSALSLLLGGLDWRPGDRVVALKDEFPNNLYYPALLSKHGVEFVETPWECFWNAVNERTRLVAMSTVNYTNGFRPPVEEVAGRLRERGVLLYLDGTQSAGALRTDLAAIRPAMYAVNGYKWMLAPNGAAFAYIHPEIRERLEPNVIGWRSHHNWRSVDRLHHGAPEFTPKAEKYEGGMLAFPPIYGLGESVKMMLELGPENIEERVRELAAQLRQVLRASGARLLYDEAPHYDSSIVAARYPGQDSSQLARELKKRHIIVSARHGNLRVSVHFYNNEQDLDRFGDGVRALIGSVGHSEP